MVAQRRKAPEVGAAPEPATVPPEWGSVRGSPAVKRRGPQSGREGQRRCGLGRRRRDAGCGAMRDWTVMFYVTASNLEAESAAYVEHLEQEAARLPGTVNLALLYDQAGGQIPISDAHGNPAGTRPAVEFATGGGTQPWGGRGGRSSRATRT